MRLVFPLVALAVLVLAAYAPASVPAEPEPAPRWENLQVLPDTLSRDALFGIMRGFTEALGVGCDHCHATGDSGPDFPSDANPHKDVARGMMRMTWQINTEILPAIDDLHEAEGMRVTCYTCHRGLPRPATSAADTTMAHEQGGAHEHGEGHDHDGH